MKTRYPGGKAPVYLAHILLKSVAIGSAKFNLEDDGFDGFGIALQIIKSRSNQAGQTVNLIYDKVRGIDPLRTCLLYAKEQGYITVEVHRKADGSDLPSYIGLVCTADHNNQYTAYQYLQKGTYYQKFPKNSYYLRMTLYSSAQRTLKNGSTLASYCDSVISDTFVYKATDTGYITISQKRLIETAAPMSVSFHTSKGK